MLRYVVMLIFVPVTMVYCTDSFAGSIREEVGSFAQLAQRLAALEHPEATLLVIDDDDTLTMMPCSDPSDPEQCQYLGSPAWFDWQESLLGTNSHFRVASSLDGLILIATLLFALNNMVYTEPGIAQHLRRMGDAGIRVMVLTAKDVADASATQSQFASLPAAGAKQPGENLLDLIRSLAPRFGRDGIASLAGPFTPCRLPKARQVIYQQGVMYVAGQDKGSMLQCFLDRYAAEGAKGEAASVKNIVFVDDSESNVDDVYAAFDTNLRYNALVLHYTAQAAYQAQLTGEGGQPFRIKADKRWRAIRKTLAGQLLKPVSEAR